MYIPMVEPQVKGILWVSMVFLCEAIFCSVTVGLDLRQDDWADRHRSIHYPNPALWRLSKSFLVAKKSEVDPRNSVAITAMDERLAAIRGGEGGGTATSRR